MSTLALRSPFMRPAAVPAATAKSRKLALLIVIALHGMAGAALLQMQLNKPDIEEPALINIQWMPSETNTPSPAPTPRSTPVENRPRPQPTPVPQAAPTPTPVSAAPLIQTEAATAAPSEATKPSQATPAAAAPSPAAPVAHTATQPAVIEQNFNAQVDCVASPKPIYPKDDLADGHQGTTLLRMQVDERGFPLQVEIASSSGFKTLDRAARQHIMRTWQCPMRAGTRKLKDEWFGIPIVWTL